MKNMSLAAPVYACDMPSPVGKLKLIAHEDALVAVLWQHEKPNRVLLGQTTYVPDLPIFHTINQQLMEYFDGTRQTFDVALKFYGTAFQQQVWQALQHIPFGHSCSYGALAQRINRPTAVRAVGAVVGRNPLSIIVPCHRIIGSNGQLTGFAGGLENKKILLDLEQIVYRP